MTAAEEARMHEEHRAKYEALALLLGVDALRALLPATPERIAAALAAGDEHLNTIPLAAWDRAAGVRGVHEREKCACCGQLEPWRASADWPYEDLRRTGREEPWKRIPSSSLAERVCVLKHVARYHMTARPAGKEIVRCLPISCAPRCPACSACFCC